MAPHLQALGFLKPRYVLPNATLSSLHTHHLQQVFPDCRRPLHGSLQAHAREPPAQTSLETTLEIRSGLSGSWLWTQSDTYCTCPVERA